MWSKHPVSEVARKWIEKHVRSRPWVWLIHLPTKVPSEWVNLNGFKASTVNTHIVWSEEAILPWRWLVEAYFIIWLQWTLSVGVWVYRGAVSRISEGEASIGKSFLHELFVWFLSVDHLLFHIVVSTYALEAIANDWGVPCIVIPLIGSWEVDSNSE